MRIHEFSVGDSTVGGFDYETSCQYDFLGLVALLVEEEHMHTGKSMANALVAQRNESVGAYPLS